MKEYTGESYTSKTIKNKLQDKYGTKISFCEKEGFSSLIVLDKIAHLITQEKHRSRDIDEKSEAKKIVLLAAELIKESIMKFDDKIDCYPSIGEIENGKTDEVPELLKEFVNVLVNDSLKRRSLSQAIYSGCKSIKSFPHIMPLQFAVAVAADCQFGSKWLNNLLYKFGFAMSYDELVRFKKSVIQHDQIETKISNEQVSLIQLVGDDTDHDLNTIDGKNTHHGLGSIVVINGDFSKIPYKKVSIPRAAKSNWASIPDNDAIPILNFKLERDFSLKTTMFRPLPKLFPIIFDKLDMLWVSAKLLKPSFPNWSGYMASFSREKTKAVSMVNFLPIIDLSSSDPNALFSLLSYISSQCDKLSVEETCVTFDQPLFVKAHEIVSSKNMNIFVRLGGFHQCMSFLGSIGNLMEGSGLREALEVVYAQNTVAHIFTGKAYSRALRGHLIVLSSLISLIMDPYINDMPREDFSRIIDLSSSDDINLIENDPVMNKLLNWFEAEKSKITEKSRTGSLWVSYIEYVMIVQNFIRAERTHNWPLHIESTQRMLNLFAATGHNNYAKSCRLYHQTAIDLPQHFPRMYEQFMLGNHTVKRTEKDWSGLWTDLAIEQILMKSLKGRGGVVGRGITDNVTRVWTKTIHRSGEISAAIDHVTLHNTTNEPDHKELSASKIKRDHADYTKVFQYMKNNNPFNVSEVLMGMSSGLVDENNIVTCDKSEEIGALIQNDMDGKTFSTAAFKRSKKVVNLQILSSNVSIQGEKLDINPLTLFLRLITMVVHQPETEIESYFYY